MVLRSLTRRVCRLSILAGKGNRWFPILSGLGVAVVCVSGCAQRSTLAPVRLADPIVPLAAALPYDAEYGHNKNCFQPQQKVSAHRPLADIVLAYVSSGRDFRPPAGPDGYIVRVVPLDRRWRPVPIAAEVTISLFNDSSPGGDLVSAQPLRLWKIPAPQVEKYWTLTNLLDGYVFRLDWGDSSLPPARYRFVVRLDYDHRGVVTSLCREITFHDLVGREQIDTGVNIPVTPDSQSETNP